MPPARRPRTATARLVIALVWGLAVPLAACTGDDGPGTATTVDPAGPASSTGDNPLEFTAYVDPGAPITVAIGERFALLLDAEPSQGLHWEVAEEANRDVVLPLGSQFLPRDRAAVASTTTTAPPPEPLPGPGTDAPPPGDDDDGGDPGGPATAIEPDTTTTSVPTESVQVLSYVGRGVGTTTVVLRYVTVDGSPVEERTSTFTIQVVDPTAPPPPPEGSAEGDEPGPATG